MERVLRQEGLTKLGVTKLSVVVLVETRHKESHLVVSHFKAQVFQSVDEVLNASSSSSCFIKDAESVN